MGKPTLVGVGGEGGLSDARVIMTIMCVPIVELLCQASMGWIPILKYLLSGVCGHVLSCQALNATAS
jgi:hypothetical protein